MHDKGPLEREIPGFDGFYQLQDEGLCNGLSDGRLDLRNNQDSVHRGQGLCESARP